MTDIFNGYGVEVTLKNDNFSVICETLTRIGIISKKEKSLTQSCHLFHKQGQYRIMHFKELLSFDEKSVNITHEDIRRRDSIAALLEQWDLLEIKDDICKGVETSLFSIISHKNKKDWVLKQKYTLGC